MSVVKRGTTFLFAVWIIVGLLFTLKKLAPLIVEYQHILSTDSLSIALTTTGGGEDSIANDSLSSIQPSSNIEDLVEWCMRNTNLIATESSSLLKQAKFNAKYILEEYRKVVPEKSLDRYGSHCWKQPYSVKWDKVNFSGHIGNISFDGSVVDSYQGKTFSYLNEHFESDHHFKTDVICLPNVYITGFPKCGSSFAYCVISRLILGSSPGVKEPHFWVTKNATMPSASDFGKYIMDFIPILRRFSSSSAIHRILIDGSVNKMFKWPRFAKTEHSLANYCLLPTVMPKLFPRAKYITVMREPISMLYSTFWYSCSRLKGVIPSATQMKGPSVFHERIVAKLNMFNQCMRDSSIPSLSQACTLDSSHNYSSCITQRIHLLDECAQAISENKFSPDMPDCGKTRITMGLYFTHIRKWLSVVPRKNFLFLILESLSDDLAGSMHETLQFLDIRGGVELLRLKHVAGACGRNNQHEIHYRDNPHLQMRKETRVLLEMFFEPFNVLLAQLIGKEISWQYRTHHHTVS